MQVDLVEPLSACDTIEEEETLERASDLGFEASCGIERVRKSRVGREPWLGFGYDARLRVVRKRRGAKITRIGREFERAPVSGLSISAGCQRITDSRRRIPVGASDRRRSGSWALSADPKVRPRPSRQPAARSS
ncbi:hypothetical protein C8039_03460 [Halogeometricum sp. wsp3]|nr:hypothetical protein C8039_03460 [Halogeometricum sp. wsp3]